MDREPQSSRLRIPGAVIVEDVSEEAERLAQLCKHALALDTPIVTIVAQGPRAVMEAFQERAGELLAGTVAFLDICLEADRSIHSGRDVAEHVRTHRPDIPIVLYTVRADIAAALELLDDGLIDGFVDKDAIRRRRLSILSFNQAVTKAVHRRRDRIAGAIPLAPAPSAVGATAAEWLAARELARLGREEVATLIAGCVQGALRAELQYLAPGLSGAVVFRCHVLREAQAAVRLVLKLSRDRTALEADYRHTMDVGALPGRLVPHLRPEGIRNGFAGLHAYAMEEVPGHTLAELLLAPHGADLVEQTLVAIRALHDRDRAGAQVRPLSTPWATDAERASVLVELERGGPMFEKYVRDAVGFVDGAREFVLRGRLLRLTACDIARVTGQMPAGMQHGDLHMGNIVVEEAGGSVTVCLIDWARYGLYPLGVDLARLESEFRLRIVGSEDCSDVDPRSIARWREIDTWLHADVSKAVPGARPPAKGEWIDCLVAIRREAQRQLEKAETNVDRRLLAWWYYFALFRHYVTGVGYERLQPAKRAWAFAAAAGLANLLQLSL